MFLFNKRGCINMATFSKCVQAIYSMHEFLEDFNSLSIAGRPALLSSCVLTFFTGWCVVLGQTRKCFEASWRCWGHKPITNPFPDTFKLCSPWQDLHCLWTQSLKYTQAALLKDGTRWCPQSIWNRLGAQVGQPLLAFHMSSLSCASVTSKCI